MEGSWPSSNDERQPVWASVSSPAYHASAMDGYAVRAADSATASETNPIQLELGPQDNLPPIEDAVRHGPDRARQSTQERADLAPDSSEEASMQERAWMMRNR